MTSFRQKVTLKSCPSGNKLSNLVTVLKCLSQLAATAHLGFSIWA